MRNYQLLNAVKRNDAVNSLEFYLNEVDDDQPKMSLRREGAYVTISASYGALEIALRPRYEDLARTLGKLQVVEGLATSRQVGTAQAFVALGRASDGSLLMRLTIVADATGHLSLNLNLTDTVRDQLYSWLEVDKMKLTDRSGTGPLN